MRRKKRRRKWEKEGRGNYEKSYLIKLDFLLSRGVLQHRISASGQVDYVYLSPLS